MYEHTGLEKNRENNITSLQTKVLYINFHNNPTEV